MSALLHLMGFVLAHACWIVADLPKGEVLAPFAIIERVDGGRVIQPFEAATQGEAVAAGKALLDHPPVDAVRIAFVRDGLLRAPDGTATDVLSVTGWERGRPELTISQPYRSDGPSRFQLLAGAFVSLGHIEDEALALKQLREGVDSHPHAGSLWPRWAGKLRRA